MSEASGHEWRRTWRQCGRNNNWWRGWKLALRRCGCLLSSASTLHSHYRQRLAVRICLVGTADSPPRRRVSSRLPWKLILAWSHDPTSYVSHYATTPSQWSGTWAQHYLQFTMLPGDCCSSHTMGRTECWSGQTNTSPLTSAHFEHSPPDPVFHDELGQLPLLWLQWWVWLLSIVWICRYTLAGTWILQRVAGVYRYEELSAWRGRVAWQCATALLTSGHWRQV